MEMGITSLPRCRGPFFSCMNRYNTCSLPTY
jgi:hypothetical protein